MNSMIDNSMIEIRVEVTGLLYLEMIDNKSTLILDEGTTVKELLKILNVRKEHAPFISVLINEQTGKRSDVLRNGDVIKLYLPTGGG